MKTTVVVTTCDAAGCGVRIDPPAVTVALGSGIGVTLDLCPRCARATRRWLASPSAQEQARDEQASMDLVGREQALARAEAAMSSVGVSS